MKMYSYSIDTYDGESEATHEIEVQWPTGLVTPPVCPVGSVLSFQSWDAPDLLQVPWQVVEIHFYLDYKGDGTSSISYLVKKD